MEGYVVELDENMKVVRKILFTNPLQLAVHDSIVVVTAIVRATNGFGFQSPDTTIKITKTSNNQDGYVVYVMDREFHYKRHGLVEGQIQKLFNPYATLISKSGEVFISLSADGDLYFQGMPPFTAHSGTVLAKLNGPAIAAVGQHSDYTSGIFPNPASNTITIAQPGDFTFYLTNVLGNKIGSGSATDRTAYDISELSSGTYFVVIETAGSREIRAIKKM